MNDELEQALTALGATPKQKTELGEDEERALGWVEWARRTGKGIGLVLTQYRSGASAPDLDEFYKQASGKRGPDYGTLLRVCGQLVDNAGREYLREDLEAEFVRYGALPKVGNGATLTDADRERLLARADEMRSKWEQAVEGRLEGEARATVGYYKHWAETPHRRAYVRDTVIPRLRHQGLMLAVMGLEEWLAEVTPTQSSIRF